MHRTDSLRQGSDTMEILLSADELAAGIGRLSDQVKGDVGRRPLMVVGVLTGSIVLVADLIRRLEGPVSVSMVWASSYRGTATSPGKLEMRLDLLPDLTGQDVLLVDDIFDTGHTLKALLEELRRRGRRACGRWCSSGRRAAPRSTSSPTSSDSTFPTSSWSVMVSTSTADCGTSRISRRLDDDDIAAARAGQIRCSEQPASPS